MGPHPPPLRGGHARACTARAFAAHRGRSTSERGSRSVALRGPGGGERTTCLSGRRGVVTCSLSSGFGGSRTGSRRRGFDSCSLSGGLGSSGAGSTRDAFAATTTRACRLGFLTGSSPRAAQHAYLSMLYHTCLWLDCACGCSACCTCPLQPFVSPRPLPPTLLPTWLPHVVKHAAWAFGARPAGARAAEHTSALTAPLPTALGLPTHGEQWVWQWQPLWLWQMDPQRRTEAVEHLEAQNATEAEAGRQLARSLQRHLRQHLDAMGLPPTRLWWSELLPMGAAAMRRGTAQFLRWGELLPMGAAAMRRGTAQFLLSVATQQAMARAVAKVVAKQEASTMRTRLRAAGVVARMPKSLAPKNPSAGRMAKCRQRRLPVQKNLSAAAKCNHSKEGPG